MAAAGWASTAGAEARGSRAIEMPSFRSKVVALSSSMTHATDRSAKSNASKLSELVCEHRSRRTVRDSEVSASHSKFNYV